MTDHTYSTGSASGQTEHKKPKCGTHCCVPLCTSNGIKYVEGHGRISYHTFPPKSSPLRKQWLVNIRRDENSSFTVKSHTTVCSLHFTSDSIEVHGFSGRHCLKPYSVPTVFTCWKEKRHIYKEAKPRPSNRLQESKTKEDIGINISTIQEDVAYPPSAPILETTDWKEKTQETAERFLLSDRIKKLENKIKSLERIKASLENENLDLKKKLDESVFCVENVKENECSFYTGFPNRTVFNEVLKYLNPGENGENIILNCSTQDGEHTDTNNGVKLGRPRKLTPANQFFLFLCRVKAGLFELDLAKRFGLSIGSVSNIIISWANFIYLRLGSLNIWPSKEQVVQNLPESFKEKYPTTRVILDCTEIKLEMPSSLLLKSQTYSNYKSSNTLKGLIGIAPCGSITFVSQLYTGCISDRAITIRSGILLLPFDRGDSVMADKGFEIQDLLDDLGVKLNIPPFLELRGQMSEDDVHQTQSIAAERIHVERAINKVKNFHIFDQVIPLSLSGTINQIWTVCALLTLFQEPIISSVIPANK